MDMELDSRNAALVVGDELRDSIEIPGYEDQSIWGFDLNARSYWASLWPNNGDRDAPPTVSIGWSGPPLRRPDCVLVELCTHLQLDPLTVARGLGLMQPINPRTPEQLVAHFAKYEPGVESGVSDAVNLVGAWLVGNTDRCPASNWPSNPGFVPSAEHLWTEVLYASGRIYLGERTSLLTSIDMALGYAAGLGD